MEEENNFNNIVENILPTINVEDKIRMMLE